MAVGAVGGMVAGDVARFYRGLDFGLGDREQTQRQVREAQYNQQVEQMEHPKPGRDFLQTMAGQAAAHTQAKAAFDAKLAALEGDMAASAARTAEVMKLGRSSPDWAHPAGVMNDGGRVTRTYKMPDGRYADFTGNSLTPEYGPVPKKQPVRGTHPAAAGMPPAAKAPYPASPVAHPVTPVPGMPPPSRSPTEAGGELDGVRNAMTALDSLAGAANSVTAAFGALVARADTMFKLPGLQFQPSGQTGGWYPGKS